VRIVALADIHSSLSHLNSIRAQCGKADLTLVVGDITSFGSSSEAQTIIEGFQQHSRSLLAVAGNCDSAEISRKLEDIGVGIHAKGRVIGDIGFFGLAGSGATPFHTPFELSETQIQSALQQGLSEVSHVPRKVLISHAPPYGTRLDTVRGGIHAGNRTIRTFVEQEQPELLLCGHIHESPGIDQIGRTQMVNLGPARLGCYAIIHIADRISIEQYGVS